MGKFLNIFFIFLLFFAVVLTISFTLPKTIYAQVECEGFCQDPPPQEPIVSDGGQSVPPPSECHGSSCEQDGGGGTGPPSLFQMYICTDPKPLTANGKIKQQCNTNSFGSFPSPCYTAWGTWGWTNCHYTADPCTLDTFGGSPGRCGGFNGKDAGMGAGPCTLTSDGQSCEATGDGGLPGGYCETETVRDEDGVTRNCIYKVNLCATPNTEPNCWGQVGDNGSGGCYWYCPNGTYAPPTPTPTPTPAAPANSVVSGSLKIQNGASCSTYTAPPNPSINLTPSSPTGVNTSCSVSLSTYTCTITYDNMSVPASQNYTVAASLSGSGTGNIKANCGDVGTNTVANVATGTSYPNNDLYFTISPWIKLKDTSVNVSAFPFTTIPSSVVSFGADDPGNRVFVDGEGGIVSLATSPFPDEADIPASSNNWRHAGYSAVKTFTSPALYLDYVKSRKSYTSISDIANIDADGIYHYTGSSFTLSSAPTHNVVLIIDNSETTVTIPDNLTQTTGFAILTNGTVSVSSTVDHINGIYIASTFNTGEEERGLEISGNLIASSFQNGRSQSNNLTPSVFVNFDTDLYLKLLPYLSISKYDQTIE